MPLPEVWQVYGYEPHRKVLRFTQAIAEKCTKVERYRNQGIIRPEDRIILAISGVKLPMKSSPITPPEIVQSLYPVGEPVAELDRSKRVIRNIHFNYRDVITKCNGSRVGTAAFLDENNSQICGVLYSECDWGRPEKLPGCSFAYIHNYKARSPLPIGWFPRGCEYWWEENLNGNEIGAIRIKCHTQDAV